MGQVIRRVQHKSQALLDGFNQIPAFVKLENTINFTSANDSINPDICYVGTHLPEHPMERFQIFGLEDLEFYARPVIDDPTIPIGEVDHDLEELIRLMLNELGNTGTISTNHLIVPSPMKPPCYYGQYFDTFQDAIATVVTWLSMDPTDLPKEYHPPIGSVLA